MGAGADTPSKHKGSAWSPFHFPAFTVIWIATVVANIGTWMYSAASGWLMTSLNPDPLIVSLVQVVTTLPLFLFALPAGALADILDKRKLLIWAESVATIASAIFAALVTLGHATSVNLLIFTFLIGAGGALGAPAWQAVVPSLVPKSDLEPAIAANSVGFNVSRAIGPALGGVLVAWVGISAPFWLNALANVGILVALFWWRPQAQPMTHLPAERFGGAIRAGFRHARSNQHLRATLIRGAAFFLSAGAYWALLPLVARSQIAGGPSLYGVLLGAIGAGAVAAAFGLPTLRARMGADRLTATATLGTAVALVLLGIARDPVTALLACILAGASWIAALSTLNVSAQMALPDWVRARGLAIFVTVFFGTLTVGSAIWGELAALFGLPFAHFIAAGCSLVSIPLTWRWKLQTGAGLDLTPSLHWPAPIIAFEVEQERGPVLVTVEYQIDPVNRDAFLTELAKVGLQRRRDGAYAWGVFEDTAQPGRMIETFLVESWLEHLRQHERVTNADRVIEHAADRFHTQGSPTVTHLVAARRTV
jgi:predicted MFS family arabinose efflux permease